MDVKDLRTEAALRERNNDGSKYTQGGVVALQSNRNKSYHDMGSNSLGKAEGKASVRPCAVIGPDRVLPPPASNDAFIKKGSEEPWLSPDTVYRRLPDYPHRHSTQNPVRNISPRQTFQENMQRINVPPVGGTYNVATHSDSVNFNHLQDRNVPISKNVKPNVVPEAKYCDVPYALNAIANEPKNIREPEMYMPSVNPSLTRPAPQVWPPGSVNVNASRTYSANEPYQYPQYPSYAGQTQRPSVIPMARPHRTIQDDPTYVYPDHYYPDASARFKPFPHVKERYPHPRFEYISNYPSQYHPPPPIQPLKFDIPKSAQTHPYSMYPHLKYLDNRVPDPSMENYQRPPASHQPHYNLQFRNQVIHSTYAQVPGSTLQKLHPYPPDGSVKTITSNNNNNNTKMYIDYENARSKSYPMAENYYVNELNRIHPVKNQMVMPNYSSIGMRTMPSQQYYLKDNIHMKHYEYMPPHLRNFEPQLTSNPVLQHAPQFSPNTLAISPTDSSTSNGTSQEDCGYVSQSSTTSVRSLESNIFRLPQEYYKRHDFKYSPVVGSAPSLVKTDVNNSKDNRQKQIDVRQFLSMWNEGEEENSGNNNSKEVIIQTGSSETSNFPKQHANQDQLYVLGLVNVPSEDLSKYEHIEKISKLPENIKGYNNLELYSRFEEAMESCNTAAFKMAPKEYQIPSKDNPMKQFVEALPRPVSPFDVESKISQSIIHKEVGCNFELRPCTPKMLNVEVAAPAQNILSERVIEKVANPHLKIDNQPLPIKSDDNSKCHAIQKHENAFVMSDNPSCKMTCSPYSSNNMDSVKTNYSLQDLEINSGICLASLPRLDNEIELNFPEVNQQFINANKRESLATEKKCNSNNYREESSLPDRTNTVTDSEKNKSVVADADKTSSKLSKYRKSKASDTCSNKEKTIRTDSVIIKNPENLKNIEDKLLENSINLPMDLSSPMGLSSQLSQWQNSPAGPNENKDNDTALDFSLNKSGNDLPVIEMEKELQTKLYPINHSQILSKSILPCEPKSPLNKSPFMGDSAEKPREIVAQCLKTNSRDPFCVKNKDDFHSSQDHEVIKSIFFKKQTTENLDFDSKNNDKHQHDDNKDSSNINKTCKDIVSEEPYTLCKQHNAENTLSNNYISSKVALEEDVDNCKSLATLHTETNHNTNSENEKQFFSPDGYGAVNENKHINSKINHDFEHDEISANLEKLFRESDEEMYLSNVGNSSSIPLLSPNTTYFPKSRCHLSKELYSPWIQKLLTYYEGSCLNRDNFQNEIQSISDHNKHDIKSLQSEHINVTLLKTKSSEQRSNEVPQTELKSEQRSNEVPQTELKSVNFISNNFTEKNLTTNTTMETNSDAEKRRSENDIDTILMISEFFDETENNSQEMAKSLTAEYNIGNDKMMCVEKPPNNVVGQCDSKPVSDMRKIEVKRRKFLTSHNSIMLKQSPNRNSKCSTAVKRKSVTKTTNDEIKINENKPETLISRTKTENYSNRFVDVASAAFDRAINLEAGEVLQNELNRLHSEDVSNSTLTAHDKRKGLGTENIEKQDKDIDKALHAVKALDSCKKLFLDSTSRIKEHNNHCSETFPKEFPDISTTNHEDKQKVENVTHNIINCSADLDCTMKNIDTTNKNRDHDKGAEEFNKNNKINCIIDADKEATSITCKMSCTDGNIVADPKNKPKTLYNDKCILNQNQPVEFINSHDSENESDATMSNSVKNQNTNSFQSSSTSVYLIEHLLVENQNKECFIENAENDSCTIEISEALHVNQIGICFDEIANVGVNALQVDKHSCEMLSHNGFSNSDKTETNQFRDSYIENCKKNILDVETNSKELNMCKEELKNDNLIHKILSLDGSNKSDGYKIKSKQDNDTSIENRNEDIVDVRANCQENTSFQKDNLVCKISHDNSSNSDDYTIEANQSGDNITDNSAETVVSAKANYEEITLLQKNKVISKIVSLEGDNIIENSSEGILDVKENCEENTSLQKDTLMCRFLINDDSSNSDSYKLKTNQSSEEIIGNINKDVNVEGNSKEVTSLQEDKLICEMSCDSFRNSNECKIEANHGGDNFDSNSNEDTVGDKANCEEDTLLQKDKQISKILSYDGFHNLEKDDVDGRDKLIEYNKENFIHVKVIHEEASSNNSPKVSEIEKINKPDNHNLESMKNNPNNDSENKLGENLTSLCDKNDTALTSSKIYKIDDVDKENFSNSILGSPFNDVFDNYAKPQSDKISIENDSSHSKINLTNDTNFSEPDSNEQKYKNDLGNSSGGDKWIEYYEQRSSSPSKNIFSATVDEYMLCASNEENLAYPVVENSIVDIENQTCNIPEAYIPELPVKRTLTLKRSFSDSALNRFKSKDTSDRHLLDNTPMWPPKRRKIYKFDHSEQHAINKNFSDFIQNNRRNSVSSHYNADNVSICILIDNDCILTDEDEGDKICFAEVSEDFMTEVNTTEVEDNVGEVICCPEENELDFSGSVMLGFNGEKSIEEAWLDDVAHVETVVSDDIDGEETYKETLVSPREIELLDCDESGIFNSDVNELAHGVNFISEEIISDDVSQCENTYTSPRDHDILHERESHEIDNAILYNSKYSETTPVSYRKECSPLPTFDLLPEDTRNSELPEDKENFDNCSNYCANRADDVTAQTSSSLQHDIVAHLPESSMDNVFSYKKDENDPSYTPSSSSPEVSSTTFDDKSSSILLKITNFNGSRVSELNEVNRNRPRCKFTESKDYSNSHGNFPKRPLMTKGAQKYIPPLKESISDLKVKLSLPQQSLLKLKQLKLSRSEPKVVTKQNISAITKKLKPKLNFEDVLKNIDEVHIKMHKEKSKKHKKSVPKVVIKKNLNGSHYTSSSSKQTFNPDLTGRKWQPWVFLEKNLFIDNMVIRNKTTAIFSHRQNKYVLAEKFKRYKSTSNCSTKFVISQPKTGDSSKGQLKYTIRLKHTY